MNTVQGKVLGRNTGRGLPRLVVECYDVDAATTIADFRKGNSKRSRAPIRLGSTTTDDNGEFKIVFDGNSPPSSDPTTRASTGAATRNAQGHGKAPKAPNLLLTVSAPEGLPGSGAPLHVSPSIRRNAGTIETYVINISEGAVEEAGLFAPTRNAPPGDAEPVPEIAKRLLAAAKRDVAISQAIQNAAEVKVDAARATTTAFNKDFRPALEGLLTSVSPDQRKSETFVAADTSVMKAHTKVIETDLKAVVNDEARRPPVLARIALTDAQRRALADKLDGNKSISEDDLRIITRNATPTSTEYLRTDPLAVMCRELTDGEVHCASALGITVPEGHGASSNGDGPEAGGGAPHTNGTGSVTIDADDIPGYLGRLVDTMTSPEEGVLAGLEPRATQGNVSAHVQDLAFKPSPADTTAFYDFHNLQVAFRHVWQEAVDDGILTLAQAAYDEIVIGGGAPSLAPGKDPIRTLVSSANAVIRARPTSSSSSPTAAAHTLWPGIGDLMGGLLGTVAQPPEAPQEPLAPLLAELQQRLQEPYAFTTFAANRQERSVNFGTLVTYRQKWQPLAYQAGKLARTITLAPKEIRKYTKTVKRHRKRAEKEVENHLSIVKQETSQTSRIEQEIVRKANTRTSFQFSAESTVKDPTGMEEGTTKTSFEREASQVSEGVKKSFHESVMKAAQEFKDELSVEITTEEGEDFEETETGEITNPNDELAVTFLFYELQRCYRVSENIHRLTPLVLVAQEMPKPHEINEAWLVSHDWILRRALLDDSFAAALTYLSTKVVGDQVALSEMRTNIQQQRAIIAELKQELTVVRSRIATYRNLLEKSLLQTAQKKHGGGGLFGSIPIVGGAIDLAEDAIGAVGDFIHPDTPQLGDSRQDTLKEAITRTVDEERDLLMRIEREVTSLNALTETYSKALAENFNQRTQILRLRTHVKQNITYYMQAIWNHEPPDQRYLRLHETPVPTFRTRRRFVFPELAPRPGMMASMAHRRLGLDVLPPTNVLECVVVEDLTLRETKPLAQVADLDNLIGYFGNYMMFALKESNPLTDFMMAPYVLQGFNELTDPDDLGNWSLDEFVRYVCCLRDKLTPEQFDQAKPELQAQYDRLIKAPRRNGDVLTLPTGSLFIEALPASTSLMERFKAIHRSIDVKKAQADTRQAEVRNLWMVDRLLHGEREDPDIDKKVIIEGAVTGPSVPIDDPA